MVVDGLSIFLAVEVCAIEVRIRSRLFSGLFGTLGGFAWIKIVIERERKHEFDPAFGFRKLVHIAERSIVQPIDDPTTTIQAIHRLHDCLRQLAPRPFPSSQHYDAEGEHRLVTHTLGWDGYVRLAFDELRLVAAGSPQVARRLQAALEDLKMGAPPERQAALERQLELLEALVRQEL